MHEQRQTAFASHTIILVIQPKLIITFARAAAYCFYKSEFSHKRLIRQRWDSALKESRGKALDNGDTGHGPYRGIKPISSKTAVA